ncbi:MAG: hypothetical protein ACRDBO_04980 [Lachnospiraceae bacterium]
MKYTKRILSVMFTVLLLALSTTTVWALPSPSSPGVVQPEDGKDNNGDSIEVIIEEVPKDEYPGDIENGKNPIDIIEVIVPEGSEGPYEIVVNIPGATSDLVAYQYIDGEWVPLAIVVNGDNVTFIIDRSVPIAFYGGDRFSSPKTGEGDFMRYMTAIMLLSATGMIFTYKRSR